MNRLYLFLNTHELSGITGTQCTICTNYISLKLLDQDIDHNLIRYYCKGDKTIDKIELKKLTSKAQRIHVVGSVWNVINSLKHRKFAFFCKEVRQSKLSKDSICITDTDCFIDKIDNKMIITQGYSKEYNLTSIDFLLIEKKYIDESFETIFDKNLIPEKGYLVINLHTNTKFYTT